MRVAIFRVLLALTLTAGCLTWAEPAVAGCGDVTDDQDVTAGDALAVLRAAVGQNVQLSCTYDDVLLDLTESPLYGQVNLTGGYVPDPHTIDVTSGGPVDVSYLGTPCEGFAGSRPDFRVIYTAAGSSFLRFYWIPDAAGDATMVVNDPDSAYWCNDDSFSTSDPSIDFDNPSSGTYDIWIGSFNQGENYSGTLYVTELTGNHP